MTRRRLDLTSIGGPEEGSRIGSEATGTVMTALLQRDADPVVVKQKLLDALEKLFPEPRTPEVTFLAVRQLRSPFLSIPVLDALAGLPDVWERSLATPIKDSEMAAFEATPTVNERAVPEVSRFFAASLWRMLMAASRATARVELPATWQEIPVTEHGNALSGLVDNDNQAIPEMHIEKYLQSVRDVWSAIEDVHASVAVNEALFQAAFRQHPDVVDSMDPTAAPVRIGRRIWIGDEREPGLQQKLVSYIDAPGTTACPWSQSGDGGIVWPPEVAKNARIAKKCSAAAPINFGGTEIEKRLRDGGYELRDPAVVTIGDLAWQASAALRDALGPAAWRPQIKTRDQTTRAL